MSSLISVSMSPEHNSIHRQEDSEYSEGLRALSVAAEEVAAGKAFSALEGLRKFLLAYRDTLGAEPWRKFARDVFPSHPLVRLVHQSPFSSRSYSKPRGYPGDAVLLDLIYGEAVPSTVSEIGQACYSWERQTASCRSVRARRDLLTERIDCLLAGNDDPRILSIACGHLRELKACRELHRAQEGAILALDQDAESLEEVKRCHPQVKTVSGSVRAVISQQLDFRDLDFAYAAGLYDYLSDSAAKRLTFRMFSMLRSGGKLLVANFHPSLEDIGGMETIMGWWLTYRTESQVEGLLEEIPQSHVSGFELYRDTHRNIVFLEVQKC